MVVYCGCCPMTRGPNIRPALRVLTEMGFRHVKVLWLPQDFHTDWIGKGIPSKRGSNQTETGQKHRVSCEALQ